MSDTPRTDAYYDAFNSWMAYAAKYPNMSPEQAEHCPIEQSPEDFARTLERENTRLRKAIAVIAQRNDCPSTDIDAWTRYQTADYARLILSEKVTP